MTDIDLLQGRLTLRAPADAIVQARDHGVMGAPASTQMETRVVWEKGVVMAYELFETARVDLASRIAERVAAWQPVPAVAPMRLDGLAAFSLTPPSLDLKREAVFAQGAFVALPDGTVVLVSVYVNPAFAADEKAARQAAADILATLAPGGRALVATAGPRDLGPFGATVPDGYVQAWREGPDFTVHYLRRLVEFGAKGAAVGVYVGGHPAYQHQQTDDAPKVAVLRGTLLGQPVAWHEWTGASGVRTIEAIVEVPRDLRVHVFLSAGDVAHVQELRRIADSLNLR